MHDPTKTKGVVIIEKIRNGLIKFMYGRYGTDNLYLALTGTAFFLIFINMFLQTPIIMGLIFTLFTIAYFRVFSKNIYKRQRENTLYLKQSAPLKKSLKLLYKRVKDLPTHRYRQCPNCHQTLRLRRKVGTHQTVCPKCHTKMTVKIHF